MEVIAKTSNGEVIPDILSTLPLYGPRVNVVSQEISERLKQDAIEGKDSAERQAKELAEVFKVA